MRREYEPFSIETLRGSRNDVAEDTLPVKENDCALSELMVESNGQRKGFTRRCDNSRAHSDLMTVVLLISLTVVPEKATD